MSAGTGTARVTLSFPGWDEGHVIPTTIEMPIREVTWRGLAWHYGQWAAMALLAAVSTWIVLFKRAWLAAIARTTLRRRGAT